LNVSQGSTHHTFQAVWKSATPSGMCSPPGDCTTAVLGFLLLTCVIYKVLVMP